MVSFFDKVFSERNLYAAFHQQVARNDGAPCVDHVSVHEFGQQIPENLWHLSDSLKADTYHPYGHSVAFTFQNPGLMRLVRWGFPPFETASSRQRS